jgi:hypothetical protein
VVLFRSRPRCRWTTSVCGNIDRLARKTRCRLHLSLSEANCGEVVKGTNPRTGRRGRTLCSVSTMARPARQMRQAKRRQGMTECLYVDQYPRYQYRDRIVGGWVS